MANIRYSFWLGHDKSFLYEPRGFKNIYEHDKQIIENWNKIIQPEDEIFHLGDVMLGDNEYGLSCVKQLKGNIHLIRGNHCTNIRMGLYHTCDNIVEICEGRFLRYKGYNFYLSHYPCLTSNHDEDKPLKARTISICGHSHTKDKFKDMDKGLIFHVELDTNSNKPWLLDDIIIELKNYLNKTNN